jgi:hypothetical protein
MHRTLKEDTAKPPASTVTAQQKKFDRFRLVFNHERPHEVLVNDLCAQHLVAPKHGGKLSISKVVPDAKGEQQRGNQSSVRRQGSR